MSLAHDYEAEIWDGESDETWRSVEALTELTGLDIDDVVHQFGLGFVEEHGVNIGTVVDAIYLNELDWLIAR